MSKKVSSFKESLPVLISRSRIEGCLKELARRINRDYLGKNLYIVCILKGAFVFMADLIRQLKVDAICDFIMLSSYESNTRSSGKTRTKLDLTSKYSLYNKDVLIIEDIVDTGLTIKYLREKLLREKPRSVRVCTLLDKPSRRKVKVKLDYVGFRIPNRFVIGYGIDFNEQYRTLPEIRYIPESRNRKA